MNKFRFMSVASHKDQRWESSDPNLSFKLLKPKLLTTGCSTLCKLMTMDISVLPSQIETTRLDIKGQCWGRGEQCFVFFFSYSFMLMYGDIPLNVILMQFPLIHWWEWSDGLWSDVADPCLGSNKLCLVQPPSFPLDFGGSLLSIVCILVCCPLFKCTGLGIHWGRPAIL